MSNLTQTCHDNATRATNENLKAHLDLALALLEAIHSTGPNGIPSGTLYAMTMSHLDLPTYQGAINFLKNQGVITEQAHLLRATF